MLMCVHSVDHNLVSRLVYEAIVSSHHDNLGVESLIATFDLFTLAPFSGEREKKRNFSQKLLL